MTKKKNTFRSQLLLQSNDRINLHTTIDAILDIINNQDKKRFNQVKWSIDVDPQDIY